jgi:hypothetical protein
MDLSQIRESSLVIDGIDHSDHPDYCDAYFCYGEFFNRDVLTDDQLERLKELDPELFYDVLHNTIY